MFHFNKEDHTLGNMVRARLLKTEHVQYAGYRVPHPLVPTFDLRVQTDGHITPKEAVVKACRDIVQDLAELSRQFTKEWELAKIHRSSKAAAAAAQGGGGGGGAGSSAAGRSGGAGGNASSSG
jgi:DNA-directed RNA polymerase II subunit RPB11